jgi:hypothetical protein
MQEVVIFMIYQLPFYPLKHRLWCPVQFMSWAHSFFNPNPITASKVASGFAEV